MTALEDFVIVELYKRENPYDGTTFEVSRRDEGSDLRLYSFSDTWPVRQPLTCRTDRRMCRVKRKDFFTSGRNFSTM